MSVRKLTAKLLAALAIFAGGSSVSAQEHALADPFAFDPDFQWFEPIYEADMLDMKPKKRAHTGWFGTYDKLHLYGKRPEQADNGGDSYKLDVGDGHRYEFGYMKPGKDSGMLFSWSSLDVRAADVTQIGRINRLNDEQITGAPEFPSGRFGANALQEDDNNFGFDLRFYEIGRSTNLVDMDNYEIMKTWRMEPYHYGGILEPMIGARFVTMDDSAFARRYARTREDDFNNAVGNTLGLSPYFTDLGVQDDAFEVLTDEQQEISNEMYTIQAGFRYFKFVDRFRYSAEFRAFTGVNLQCAKGFTSQTTTLYDGFDVGDDVTSVLNTQSLITYERSEEFFIGYDIRADVGYQLTQMIHIRGGFQLIDLAKGVWRNASQGANSNLSFGPTDQNFLAVGGTFGLEINR